MLPEPADQWRLDNFIEALDSWIELEDPPIGMRRWVTSWLLSRLETPYAGVVRADGFADLWYGVVPNTQHGGGYVVACSYWIDPERCVSAATALPP